MGVDDGSNGGKSGEVEGGRMKNSDEENSVGNNHVYNNNNSTPLSGASSPSTKEDGYVSDDSRGKGSDDGDGTSSNNATSSASKNETEQLTVGPDEVVLRCIFANHDGVNVEIVAPMSCPILTIKESLLSSWPEGRYISSCPLLSRYPKGYPLELRTHTQSNLNSGVGNVETPSQMRLISFGRILHEDSTLELCNLPSFDHYIPINVSLRPKSQHLLRGEWEV